MDDNRTTPRHPIRVVAHRTALTPATIRAWERRYEAVRPTRSEGGQRLYSDADVERLNRLRLLTEAGRSISMVAGLSDDAAEELLEEDRAAAAAGGGERGVDRGPTGWVEDSYAAIRRLDTAALENALWQAALTLGGRAFVDDVVTPLLVRIGVGWRAGEVTPSQEHLGSETIERVLARLAERPNVAGAPALVVATLSGERHGLGARLVSVAAVLEGWNVTYLGTDLPASEVAAAATALGASAVAISVVSHDDVAGAARQLGELRRDLDSSVDVLVGGGAASLLDDEQLPTGLTVLHDLDGLREAYRNGRFPRARPRAGVAGPV